MIKKLKNLNGAKLILACALVMCAVWLGKNLFSYGYETVSRANGSLETFTLSADDFELVGIIKTEEGALSHRLGPADDSCAGYEGVPHHH